MISITCWGKLISCLRTSKATPVAKMKPENFTYISKLAKDESGLVLTEKKIYLLDSRLMPIARKMEIETLDELIERIRVRPEPPLVKEVVEALTTNETLFFRDNGPFDRLKENVLPDIMAARGAQKSFRIWSAAASSGQEPYSLAIILNEMAAKMHGWNFEIVGTDLSTEILAKAEAGHYSQFEIQRGMPVQLLVKYFKQEGASWVINDDLRAKVKFMPANLLEDQRGLGQFDIVFCRNVLIYFDPETKGKVLDMIADMMPDDGRLFLGAAETVLGLTEKFKAIPDVRGVYQKT